MTNLARQTTAFDYRSSDAAYSRSEQDDELRDIANCQRIRARQVSPSSVQENNSGETAWSREQSLQPDGLDTVVVTSSGRIPTRTFTRSFNPIAEWEGYVETIDDEEFTVRLVNIKSLSSLPEETATFRRSDLSQRERLLLVPGAIVRWVVGLERLQTDQRRRVSELHFRDLPAHAARDWDRAKGKAKDLLDSISLDEST